jgi:integrin beta 3
MQHNQIQAVIRGIAPVIKDQLSAFAGRLGLIEARLLSLEALPLGKDGEKGADGLNGKDGRDGKDGIDGKDGAPGKDGKDGLNGKDGEPGRPGVDGKSVTLEDVRTYLDAELATWALGFERRAQDVLQRAIDKIPAPKDGRDGQNGKDGRDGLGVEDFDIALDGRDLTVTITRGEFTKSRTIRIPALLDAGVFRDGTAYEKGDCVSFGGSAWIAQKDAPEGKPGVSSDWRLAVKKGRDGKDWSGPK